MIQIRRMTAKDVPAVARIEQTIFSEPWSADSFRKGIEAQSDIYLVADVLGHRSVDTTRKHYAAMEEENRRAAARAVKLREP